MGKNRYKIYEPTLLKRGYVDEAWHWRYSSARDYSEVNGLLEIKRFLYAFPHRAWERGITTTKRYVIILKINAFLRLLGYIAVQKIKHHDPKQQGK